ncbi:MAG: hypothetical protein KF734_16910 [Saprospiraceae bacterium]|nr:hypothetical protein [Saprospiraceae bacterium]
MKKLTFPDFVAKFPPIAMPVTLGEDTHHTFSTENSPLSDELIAQFIIPTEATTPDDEFTEYVPCFAIDDTKDFVALVWWKAELMNYEYVLATFNMKGHLIDREVIAYTRVDAGKVSRAVATISEGLEINIAAGASPEGSDTYDPATSRMLEMEILPTGEIA